MNLTKDEALAKIDELRAYVEDLDKPKPFWTAEKVQELCGSGGCFHIKREGGDPNAFIMRAGFKWYSGKGSNDMFIFIHVGLNGEPWNYSDWGLPKTADEVADYLNARDFKLVK